MLLTDTVGFIQKLPTKLVASFRATLVRKAAPAPHATRTPCAVHA